MPESGELLYVVMPAYNECATVAAVVREWAQVFDALSLRWVLLALDDGSKDDTLAVLEALRAELPNLEVVAKPNSGHGQTCIEGYRLALARGADWVFQIDSDGQCDPRYFAALWRGREQHPVVFGRRRHRDDGEARRVISWMCTLATRAITGVAVHDPNVPYRLMRADVLSHAVVEFPGDFKLANVLLSVVLQKALAERLGFVEIGFRERAGGQPSVKWTQFAGEGVKLCRELVATRGFAARRAGVIAATVRA